VFSADDLSGVLRQLTPSKARGFAVAVSAGADSLALLHAAVPAAASLRLPLRCVHVDHGLQAASADFAAASARAAAVLQVPFTLLRVSLPAAMGQSVEECAREARYAALGADLQPGECLLTAHHQDDQAETFLLQALRGAGLAGLAAMPMRRRMGPGWHLRPLLRVSRADLREYVRHHFTAVEDAMNADRRYDRSYLRHEVWPILRRRWPAAGEVLARSAAHVAQAHDAQALQARQDLAQLRDGAALSLAHLRRLPPERQAGALRAFLEEGGARSPPQLRLQEALRQMLEARPDAEPCVRWSGHALRRYRGRLYLTAAEPAVLPPLEWQWRLQASCDLGEGLGCLRWSAQPGGLDPARLAPVLQVRPRVGGEAIRTSRGGVNHSLRHLLQERGVVPWSRGQLPLLWAGTRLVAVADLWAEGDLRAAPGEPGLQLRWEQAPSID
jgi:tRNA(Ile)-lysidine synthase